MKTENYHLILVNNEHPLPVGFVAKDLIDVMQETPRHFFLFQRLMILCCALGNICFTVVKNLASFRSMNTMKYAAQNAAVDRLFNLPESFFREYDAAGLSQRVMGVSMIYELLASSLVQTVLAALFSILYVVRMFSISGELANVATLMLLATVLVLIWLGIKQMKFEREKMTSDLESKSFLFQFITGVEKIRVSASEQRAIQRYLEYFTRSQTINAKKERITNIVNVVSVVAPGVFSIIFYLLMLLSHTVMKKLRYCLMSVCISRPVNMLR